MRKTEGKAETGKYAFIQLLFLIKARKKDKIEPPYQVSLQKAHCESKSSESWIHSVGKTAFTLQAGQELINSIAI